MDLDNLFKSKKTSSFSKSEEKDLVVTDCDALKLSIDELYAIEGFIKPQFETDTECLAFSDTNLSLKNVILDLRTEEHVVEIVTKLTTKLDVNINIIVIGSNDSIKLKNQVSKLGANYILWDLQLNELLNALNCGSLDSIQSQPQKVRTAKRILFVGTKGGIGLSTLTSLLGYCLSVEANLKTLIVDHDSGSINADVFLGIKGLKVRQDSKELSSRDIDNAIARTFLNNANEKLDYLMLEKSDGATGTHTSNLFNLSNAMVEEYNFIVDAMPQSSFDELDKNELKDRYHRIFIVCEQTVSSLRAYNLIKKKLSKIEHTVIFNQSRPSKDFVIPLENAKVRIKAKESFSINYEACLESTFIHKGPAGVMSTKFSDPVRNLMSVLTGKVLQRKKSFKLFRK